MQRSEEKRNVERRGRQNSWEGERNYVPDFCSLKWAYTSPLPNACAHTHANTLFVEKKLFVELE